LRQRAVVVEAQHGSEVGRIDAAIPLRSLHGDVGIGVARVADHQDLAVGLGMLADGGTLAR
jgi:hypothetical protein